MDATAYAREYLRSTVFYAPDDAGIRIGLPYRGVMPNTHAFDGDQFAWDTYYMARGMVLCGLEREAVEAALNHAWLVERYGLVPSRNRLYNLGGSQPPHLSLLAALVRPHATVPEYNRLMAAAEAEYLSYWCDASRFDSHVDPASGLSYYRDHYNLHHTSEHESGWDMTSRFAGRCLDVLPVDLNALLWHYEASLAEWHAELGDGRETEWRDRGEHRANRMREAMWDAGLGCFTDAWSVDGLPTGILTAASLYPAWVGMATEAEAESTLDAAGALQGPCGLAATGPDTVSSPARQWDWPNAWPPHQIAYADCLAAAGRHDELGDFAGAWLEACQRQVSEYGTLWEKTDCRDGCRGLDGHYPGQSGFGWSAASVLVLDRMAGPGMQGQGPAR